MARLANLPRYQSLSDEIRSRIQAGEYGTGDRLPSEAELCRQHGVSRGTAVKAIEQLVAEGVAIRRQGSITEDDPEGKRIYITRGRNKHVKVTPASAGELLWIEQNLPQVARGIAAMENEA